MQPLSAVEQSVRAGATTTAEIARRTGLSASTVDAALQQLQRLGMLRSSKDTIACDECALSCGHNHAPGSSGCGSGLTTLTLLPRRPE